MIIAIFATPLWAKTGLSFFGIREKDESLLKNQHNKFKDYIKFYDEVKYHLLNGCLVTNNIINKNAIKYALSLWPKDPHLSMLFSKLYGIELLISRFNLDVPTLDQSSLSHLQSYCGSRGYNILKRSKQIFLLLK